MRVIPSHIDIHFGVLNPTLLTKLVNQADSCILPYDAQGHLLLPPRSLICTTPVGYHSNSGNRVLGSGYHKFAAASSALDSLSATDLGWVRAVHVARPGLYKQQRSKTKESHVKVGDAIVFCVRILPGLWWTGVNRVIDVAKRKGLTRIVWGTTKRHLLLGEELVEVFMGEGGKITARIESFSKPGSILAWVMWPYVRILQRKFVRETLDRLVDSSKG